MTAIKSFAGKLMRDESGAALVEYSILIGIISAAVLVSVIAVGTWVTTRWGNLVTRLGTP